MTLNMKELHSSETSDTNCPVTQHHILADLDVLQADCLKLSCNAGLSEPYGPLTLHVLPVLLHCTVMNAFKGIMNFKTPPSCTVDGI